MANLSPLEEATIATIGRASTKWTQISWIEATHAAEEAIRVCVLAGILEAKLPLTVSVPPATREFKMILSVMGNFAPSLQTHVQMAVGRRGWKGPQILMQPGHFSHMRLTGDGEQAQRDLLTNPVSALSIICGHDGFPGLQSPGRAIVDYDWEVTASFDQPPSQPKTNRQKGHHKRLKRRRNRVGLPPAEPIPVLPSFKEQEVATAIEETLRLAACRLPESQIIEKSGYARTAVRKQLARLVKLGTIIHHGKRGGYSPSNSEHKP